MNREVHVRICEGLGVKLPRATRPYIESWQTCDLWHIHAIKLSDGVHPLCDSIKLCTGQVGEISGLDHSDQTETQSIAATVR